MLQAAKHVGPTKRVNPQLIIPKGWIPAPSYIDYIPYLTDQTIRAVQDKYEYDNIVYGIECVTTNRIYVGCTVDPVKRLYQHLVSGIHSCNPLQKDITKYGLGDFSLYVFETVAMPPRLTDKERVEFMRVRESLYLKQYRYNQLYNVSRAYLYKSYVH